MEQENKASEPEKKPPQPDDPGNVPSELEVLKKRLADLETENKRIKADKIETRTDPNYIKRIREDRRKQREAKILNQRLPQAKRLTPQQLEDMSMADVVSYVDQRVNESFQAIQRDKIDPMFEEVRDGDLQTGLKKLNSIDADWWEFREDMIPIAEANRDLEPVKVYMAALAAAGKWDRLEKVRAAIEPQKEPKQTTKEDQPMEKKENKPTDVSTGGKPPVTGGERPTTSVTNVRPPKKAMSPRDAATKAYETVFERQGL